MISLATGTSLRRLARKLLACVALLVLAGSTVAAEPYREDTVKAAFLNRFTGYVEWPEDAINGREFKIAVLGAPRVAEELEQLAAERSTKNLPTRVQAIGSAGEARDAHVLFVGPAYNGNLAKLTASIGARPVLIVVDHPRGLDEGGVINFLVVDERVRFEVSLGAAQRAGLRISSQLLSVAVRVRVAKNEGAGQ